MKQRNEKKKHVLHSHFMLENCVCVYIHKFLDTERNILNCYFYGKEKNC